jgi:hypothetical protein
VISELAYTCMCEECMWLYCPVFVSRHRSTASQVTSSHTNESFGSGVMLNRNRAYVKRTESRTVFSMFVRT